MVFLIQNSQNRDARAIQLKLDELLRAMEQARTDLVNLEDCTDEELDRLQAQFQALHDRAQQRKQRREVNRVDNYDLDCFLKYSPRARSPP